MKKKGVISKFLEFLKNDVKEDFITLKELSKGKYKPKYTAKQIFDVRWMLKDKSAWMLIILLTLAFFAGRFISSQYYQDMCNSYIIDNFWGNVTKTGKTIVENFSITLP